MSCAKVARALLSLALAGCFALASPMRAHASGFPVGGAGALELFLTWGERLWPDLRFELRDDAVLDNVVLSWPVHASPPT